MKRQHFLIAAALAIASTTAFATCPNGGSNWPTCTTTTPTPPSVQPSTSSATSQSSSGATSSAGATASSSVSVAASPSSTSSATGGSVGGISQSFEEFSRSNMYVLPAPVNAAPLPSGLCPQGDSLSVGILWNMFSYARSSTRTEMECLERVLAAAQSGPEVHIIQAPALPVAVVPGPAEAPASVPAAKPKAKPAAKRQIKTAEACQTATVQACALKR